MTSSVVVLSYRPGPWLETCLRSVLDQADEVILVDNGSPGGTAATTGRRLGTKVVEPGRNLGFAGGVNLGWEHARGDILALLNDDAVAGPGWLARAGAVLADPTVAAVTPKVRLHDWYRQVIMDDGRWFAPGDARALGRQIRSVTVAGRDVLADLIGSGIHDLEHAAPFSGGQGGDRWRWTAGREPFFVPVGDAAASAIVDIDGDRLPTGPAIRLINNAGTYLRADGYCGDYGAETPDDGRHDRAAERFGASGAALVTRADVVARVGGLATPFFAYYEDTDWSWRARLAGLRLVYDPSTEVEHRRSATSGGTTAALTRYWAERNRHLCLVRNAPAGVARARVVDRVREGADQGIRRGMLRLLPWAVASRARLRRRWVLTPDDIWDQWAGVDTTWDTGPAAPRQ